MNHEVERSFDMQHSNGQNDTYRPSVTQRTERPEKRVYGTIISYDMM